jgi:hypothetical protein
VWREVSLSFRYHVICLNVHFHEIGSAGEIHVGCNQRFIMEERCIGCDGDYLKHVLNMCLVLATCTGALARGVAI